MTKFFTAPWWTVALIAAIARLAIAPEWTGVVVLCVLTVGHIAGDILAHLNKQHVLTDTARLAHLETEVRALNSAVNVKFGR